MRYAYAIGIGRRQTKTRQYVLKTNSPNLMLAKFSRYTVSREHPELDPGSSASESGSLTNRLQVSRVHYVASGVESAVTLHDRCAGIKNPAAASAVTDRQTE